MHLRNIVQEVEGRLPQNGAILLGAKSHNLIRWSVCNSKIGALKVRFKIWVPPKRIPGTKIWKLKKNYAKFGVLWPITLEPVEITPVNLYPRDVPRSSDEKSVYTGWSKKRGHSTFSQIYRKLLKISSLNDFFAHIKARVCRTCHIHTNLSNSFYSVAPSGEYWTIITNT